MTAADDLYMDIRAALAARLATIPDIQVSPYVLAQVVGPGVQIIPADAEFDQAFARGWDRILFTAQAFTPLSTDVGGQIVLDRLCAHMGAMSIKTVLETDPTLGGLTDSVHVLRRAPQRLADAPGGGGQLLVVDFTVEVRVTPN